MFRRSGFTLVELLVVIAIISLLSSIVIGSLNQARARARDSKRVQDLVQMRTALELYYHQHGNYPNYFNTGGNSLERANCWECGSNTYYDASRLTASNPTNPTVNSFISSRPSDPTEPTSGRWPSSGNGNCYGYWYKVTADRQAYKLSLVGTFEGTLLNQYANIPTNMQDPNFIDNIFLTCTALPAISVFPPSCPGAIFWKVSAQDTPAPSC